MGKLNKSGQIKSLMANLEKQINEQTTLALLEMGRPGGLINDAIVEGVEKKVYPAYEPEKYKRRKSRGGLSDPTNIRGKIIYGERGGSRLRVRFKNYTTGKRRGGEKELDGIVVTGQGYSWSKSKIYQMEASGNPLVRDFYGYAAEVIDDTIAVELAENLTNRGIPTQQK